VSLVVFLLGTGDGAVWAGSVEDKYDELVAYARSAVSTNQPYVPPSEAPRGTYNVDYPYVTYQEYNAIDIREPWDNNFLDAMGWWLQQRPRGDDNIRKTVLYRYNRGGATWEEFPYNVNVFNWEEANSGLNAGNIPDGAKYHVGIKIGHQIGPGDYPEIADMRGNGYLRFTALPPAGYGLSNRVFGFRMFAGDEKFPETRAMYAQIVSSDTFELALFSESEEVIGATWLRFSFHGPGAGYDVDLRSRFVARKNLGAQVVGVSPVLVSTMYWKPDAHDSDTVMHLSNEKLVGLKLLENPSTLTLTTLGAIAGDSEIGIEQHQRDASSYTPLPENPYHLRTNLRITDITDSTHRLQLIVLESPTSNEYNDNVVVALTARGTGIAKGEEIGIACKLRAYLTLLPAAARNWRTYR
jgi:glucan biosynthesis protein